MNQKILAIDCGLRMTGAALAECQSQAETEPETERNNVRNVHVVTSESQDLGRRQAAELPLLVESILNAARWSWSDLNFLAVTSGPGYFTGLRVGAAYATGLAFALGVKIIPVGSLEMLASTALCSRTTPHVLAVVYAGRSSVYAESFSGACSPCVTLPLGEYRADELETWLEQFKNRDVIIVSDDPERAAGALGWQSGNAKNREILLVRPDAACVARLALEHQDRAIAPDELRLTYCRSAVQT